MDIIERERKENCKKNYEEFINKFNEGSFDKVKLTVSDYVLVVKFRETWAWSFKKQNNRKNRL